MKLNRLLTSFAGLTTPAVLAGALAFTSLSGAAQTTSASATEPFLPPPAPTVSTIPSNGDVNPYGVFFVPRGFPSTGALRQGDILVSNFNNHNNLQGTGTTIVRVDAHSNVTTFYQAPPARGMTAALGVVRKGFVFAGSLPTTDGTMNTVKPGSLLVLNSKGQAVKEFANNLQLINGPRGMAVHDEDGSAQIFYSNVMGGNVIRMDLLFDDSGNIFVERFVVVASGYSHRLDPAAVVLGPSGLFYDQNADVLYVANSADNSIYAVSNASQLQSPNGTGTQIYSDPTHLHGPLDIARAPNGDLIVANSDGSNVDPNQPSELVEFTTEGRFVTEFSVDPNNGGAFGLALSRIGNEAVRFAAVDDNANSLNIWTIPIH